MRIAVMADTHVPSRADAVPEWVLAELAESDHVVHAGDFDSPEAYETIVDAAPELTAVIGNIDPSTLDLPEVATLDVPESAADDGEREAENARGVRFVVTHGTGDIASYDERVAGIVDEHAATDRLTVGISGHTHQRRDEEIGGYRLLNPGSATGAEPAPDASMFVVEVDDGTVDVEPLVE